MNKIVLILGMHRSGTSFLTNWLQQCGLYIGSELYGKDIGNKDGHFEDWNFINLHRRALKESPFDKESEVFDFETNARKLVETNNASHDQWSWKDPRTCLLLPEWHTIIPDATAIVIFRHYSFVVDSIIRRYKEQLNKQSLLAKIRGLIALYRSRKKLHNFYLLEWINYNRKIVNYLKKKERNEYLVVELETLFESGKNIIGYFNNRGVKLQYTDPAKIFNPELFANKVSVKLYYSANLEATANKIFFELVALAQTNVFK